MNLAMKKSEEFFVFMALHREQNGVAERANRTIVEMARTLKYSNPVVKYPAGMWAELC